MSEFKTIHEYRREMDYDLQRLYANYALAQKLINLYEEGQITEVDCYKKIAVTLYNELEKLKIKEMKIKIMEFEEE